jgi:hypothetical protein
VAADAVQVMIDTVSHGSTAGLVRARLRAVAGSVTARLFNVTDNVSAGSSAAVTNTAWTAVSFAVTFTPGAKTYELQVLPSLANTDVAAVGYLE